MKKQPLNFVPVILTRSNTKTFWQSSKTYLKFVYIAHKIRQRNRLKVEIQKDQAAAVTQKHRQVRSDLKEIYSNLLFKQNIISLLPHQAIKHQFILQKMLIKRWVNESTMGITPVSSELTDKEKLHRDTLAKALANKDKAKPALKKLKTSAEQPTEGAHEMRAHEMRGIDKNSCTIL